MFHAVILLILHVPENTPKESLNRWYSGQIVLELIDRSRGGSICPHEYYDDIVNSDTFPGLDLKACAICDKLRLKHTTLIIRRDNDLPLILVAAKSLREDY